MTASCLYWLAYIIIAMLGNAISVSRFSLPRNPYGKASRAKPEWADHATIR
jgi:hypothetical protein